MVTYTWIGGGGGSDWDDDGNWSGPNGNGTGHPGSSDDAILVTSDTVTGPGAADDLMLGMTPTIDGAVMAQTAEFVSNNSLVTITGSLATSTNLSVDANMITVDASGDLDASNGSGNASVEVDGDGAIDVSGTFEGSGVIVGDTGVGDLDLEVGAMATLTQPDTGFAALSIGNQFTAVGSVDVSGSDLDTGAVTVGFEGDGTLTIELGSDVTVSDNDPDGFAGLGLGKEDGSSGSLTVSDGSTLAIQSGAFDVGFDGAAAAMIEGGSIVSVTDADSGDVTIGSEADGMGDLSLFDDGTGLIVAATLTVGDEGYGTLEAFAGTSIQTQALTVAEGEDDGSGNTDTATIDGADTKVTVTDALIVGDAGTGAFDVSGGAVVTAASLTIAAQDSSGDIANDAPSEMSLDGTGTMLTVSGDGTVGDAGYGMLSLSGGATATFQSLTIAAQDSSGNPDDDAPSTVAVDGNTTQLTVTQTLFVGDGGYGILDLTDRGTVTADTLVVASQFGSGDYGPLHATDTGVSGNPSGIFESGPNATLTITGDAFVGVSGYGFVHLLAGSSLTAATLGIATDPLSGGPAVLDPSFVEVEGADSTLSVAGEATVGDAGYGALTVFDGAAATIGGTLDVGRQASSGDLSLPGSAYPSLSFVDVDGDGTSLKVSSATTFGDAGNGALVVSDKGTFTTGGNVLTFGAQDGSTGELFVYDDGTTLDYGGELNLGYAGDGAATVQYGAALTIGNLTTLGGQDGGSGTLDVVGEGSSADLADLVVGGEGDGTVTLSDDGSLSTDDLFVGNGDGSSGSVTIADGESTLDVGGALVVGASGTGSLVDDGTLSVDSGVTVGADAGGAGTLTFNGATFSSTDDVTVGGSGTGLLIVQQASDVTFASIGAGDKAGGIGTIDVDDATLATPGDVTIGGAGGGTLDLTDSATLNDAGDATVGTLASGSVQAATVASLSAFVISGDLTVGDAGIAMFTIQGEGQVSVTGDVGLGDQQGASGALTVTGADASTGQISDLVFGGSLTVGKDGAGILSVAAGASVTPFAAGSGVIEIGSGPTGAGTVMVNGTGSELTGASLAVGGTASAAGGTGLLSIGAGSLVSVSDAVVWSAGSIQLSGGSLVTDPIVVQASGTVSGFGTLAGSITDRGTITASGGTLAIANAVSGTGSVTFAANATLLLDNIASDPGGVQQQDFDVTLAGFGSTDTLDLLVAGLGAYGTVDGYTLAAAGADTDLTLTDGPATVATLVLAGNDLGDTFTIHAPMDGEIAITVAACYCPGTLIRTDCCDVPVQALAIGDTVVTAAGDHRPVRWIGRRSYAGRFLAANPGLHPILFRAGSLGDGLPRRDLRVSPKHAMFIDGVLVSAKHLVNGSTIVRDGQCSRIDYVHIELDHHDILLAEGAPSESFVDDDSRMMFHNAEEWHRLYPGRPRIPALYCAPRIEDGYELEAMRRKLAVMAHAA